MAKEIRVPDKLWTTPVFSVPAENSPRGCMARLNGLILMQFLLLWAPSQTGSLSLVADPL